jgi:hypothetical protein
MATCVLVGLIEQADGTAARDVTIRATIRTTEEDQSGQFADDSAVTSDPVVAFTGDDGRFSLPVPQGATMLLEIAAVNLRKYIAVPRQPGPIDYRTLV